MESFIYIYLQLDSNNINNKIYNIFYILFIGELNNSIKSEISLK